MGGKRGAGAGAGAGAAAGLALHTIKASYDTAVRGEQDQTLWDCKVYLTEEAFVSVSGSNSRQI